MEQGGETSWSALYDAEARPRLVRSPDGGEIRWRYREDRGTEVKVRLPQGGELRGVRSPDGRHERWLLPQGGRIRIERNAAGRLLASWLGDRPLLEQVWHPDGRLAKATFQTVKLHPQYRDDGVLTSVIEAAPGQGEHLTRWREVAFDELGRVVEVTDPRA